MSAPRLVGVVGPSGVGKDSVMAALARVRPGIGLVRRVITRAEGAGGEDCERVSDAEFARRAAAGAFVLDWHAHGMRYGIPAAEIAALYPGRIGLVNLSRAVLPRAERVFEGFVTLYLTAPAPALAARLAARGRESAAEIETRLARADFALPAGVSRVVRVANDGPLEATVEAALAALQIERV